jgi:hypothetical protein
VLTKEELFIHTLDDLDRRLDHSQGEYDALGMAWLLRKLLLNGRRSLLAQAYSDYESVTFTIHDNGVLPDGLGGVVVLQPIDGKPTKELNLGAFLKEPVFGVSWVDYHVPVKDLIAYLANVVGAVHMSRAEEPWQQALMEFDRDSFIKLPQGKFTFGVYALFEIGKVVRTSLAEARKVVSAAIGTPFELRDPLEEARLRQLGSARKGRPRRV